MFITPNSQLSLNGSNHTKSKQSFIAKLLFVAAVAGVMLATASPTNAAAPVAKDPFATDTWHAGPGMWPGTIKFDSKTKSVVLTPVGGGTMEAKYSFKMEPVSAAEKKVGDTAGTLLMTNSLGQVSESTFRVEGKSLTLKFKGDQRVEQYIRMSPQEEQADIARLKKMIMEGKVKPLKPLPPLQ